MNLNKKDVNGSYPLMEACFQNNMECVRLLIEYANKNNVILDLNGKENKYGEYPLLMAFEYCSIELIKLLMEYANKNNIILKN